MTRHDGFYKKTRLSTRMSERASRPLECCGDIRRGGREAGFIETSHTGRSCLDQSHIQLHVSQQHSTCRCNTDQVLVGSYAGRLFPLVRPLLSGSLPESRPKSKKKYLSLSVTV